jgi:uridine kinase
MEGIHGLNERLTASIPYNQKVKIYVSALNQLNIDDHNRIPTTDTRKLRRMVRDHKYRGYSAEETLLRWADVRLGEDKNIFPFQEEADFMFNSGLTYELGVLKHHAMALLTGVSSYSPAHTEAHRLIRLLEFIKEIPDSLVPLNSILREFTNGSLFRY